MSSLKIHFRRENTGDIWVSSPKKRPSVDHNSIISGERRSERNDASTQVDVIDEFRMSWLSKCGTPSNTSNKKPVAAIKPIMVGTFPHKARRPNEDEDFVVLDIKFPVEDRRDENGEPLIEVLWKEGWVITWNPLSLMENSRDILRERFEEELLSNADIANVELISRFIYEN
jgi:hypothetical protein